MRVEIKGATVCSSKYKYYREETTIYIRAVQIDRDGEKYGAYYQAVRSYRENGKVKQEVIHLGRHSSVQDALEGWEKEIGELMDSRPKQAAKLSSKLERLRLLS